MELNPFWDCQDSTEEATEGSGWSTYGFQNQNSSNKNLLRKYAPKTSTDLFGNLENIQKFKKWVTSKMNHSKMNHSSEVEDYALITGKTGVGKNEFVRVCFSDLGYYLLEYDQSINKQELEVIKESILFTSIEQIFSGEKRKGVVIDNCVDNLSNSQTVDLIKLLKKNSKTTTPTIFITSSSSKISDLLKGNCLYIDIEDPDPLDLVNFVLDVAEREGIVLCREKLEEYISLQEYVSLRDLLGSVDFLGGGDVVDYVKDFELDTVSMMDRFVNPHYETDFSNIRLTTMYTSSLLQENYIKMVKKDTSMEDISLIADLLSDGDIIKKYILTDQVWSIHDYNGIMGTFYPGTIIKRNYKKTYIAKTNVRIYEQLQVEKGFGLGENDMKYIISNIYFRLGPKESWLGDICGSALLFYNFMKKNYINDMSRALKIFEQSYKLGNNEMVVVKKIKTKFRNEWKELEK